MKTSSVPPGNLRLYERLVAAAGIRLPDDERAAFKNTKALKPYLAHSYQYALSLRPKKKK